MDLGTQVERCDGVRDDASLGHEETAVGLVDRDHVERQPITWESALHSPRFEKLVSEMVKLARLKRTPHRVLVFTSNIEAARDDEQSFTNERLELAPELIGAQQQR